MNEESATETRIELWSEQSGDFYADNLFVTDGGGIGMNVGGHVIVKSLKEWHALSRLSARPPEDRIDEAAKLIERLNRWPLPDCPLPSEALADMRDAAAELERLTARPLPEQIAEGIKRLKRAASHASDMPYVEGQCLWAAATLEQMARALNQPAEP